MFSYELYFFNIYIQYMIFLSVCPWSKHALLKQYDLRTMIFNVKFSILQQTSVSHIGPLNIFEWKPQWKPDVETFLRSLHVCVYVCLRVCMGKTRPASGPLLLSVFVLFFVVFSVPPPSLSLCVCVCGCVWRPPQDAFCLVWKCEKAFHRHPTARDLWIRANTRTYTLCFSPD